MISEIKFQITSRLVKIQTLITDYNISLQSRIFFSSSPPVELIMKSIVDYSLQIYVEIKYTQKMSHVTVSDISTGVLIFVGIVTFRTSQRYLLFV